MKTTDSTLLSSCLLVTTWWPWRWPCSPTGPGAAGSAPTGRVSPTAPTERRAAERARRLGAGPIGPQPRHQMAFRPRGHYRSQRSV